MATRRNTYIVDQIAGENNFDSITNQSIFGNTGRDGRRLRRARNYHLIGFGRLLSRRGYKPYVATSPSGGNPIQGMRMDEWGLNRDLYVVGNGELRRLNGSSWDNVTNGLTIDSNTDTQIRWTNFTDAQYNWLLFTDGINPPMAVRAGGNAELLSTITATTHPWLASKQPLDVVESHGYLLALNDYSLYITGYGTMDFAAGEVIDPQRRSLGVGLAAHSRDVVLAFYEHSVYAIQFNPFEGAAFRPTPIEGAEGCVSRDSIITKNGYTYWASQNGIYRIGDPRRGAQRISEEVQDYWDSLNQSRRYNIRAVERGSPWYEVMWLVSEAGSSEHNAVLVYNERIGGMTIFPKSSGVDGVGEFTCGCLFRGSDLVDRTLVADYNGIVHEAWGTSSADSGTSDNGNSIATEIETGFINYGFSGVSDLREVFVDGEAAEDIDFNVQGEIVGQGDVVNDSFTLGTAGAVLGQFMLNEDFLQGSTVTQANFQMPLSGRGHKIKLTHSGTKVPHIITAMTFSFIPKRARIR